MLRHFLGTPPPSPGPFKFLVLRFFPLSTFHVAASLAGSRGETVIKNTEVVPLFVGLTVLRAQLTCGISCPRESTAKVYAHQGAVWREASLFQVGGL